MQHQPVGGTSGRAARGRRERGAALIEYLILLPVLAAAVFGGVDAYHAYDDTSTVREGLHASVEQGVAGTIPSGGHCALHGRPGNDTTRGLICLTKGRIGLANADIYVKVRLVDTSVHPVTYGNRNYVPDEKHDILICAQAPLSSATGFYGSLIGGHWIQERAEMPIETPFAGPAPTEGEEALPAGTNWNWCV